MVSKILREASQAAIERQTAYEADERNRIEVPSDLTDPLPPVSRTSNEWRSQKSDLHGLVSSGAPGTLAVCCSPASIDRAMRIMSPLIQAAAVRGWPLLEPRSPEGETRLETGAEIVTLHLVEKLKTIWRSATPEERVRMRRNRQVVASTNERVPSGKLALEVVDGATYGLRRSWGDAKVQRLENILNKVMLGLFTIAERRRVERLERERVVERCRRMGKGEASAGVSRRIRSDRHLEASDPRNGPRKSAGAP